MSMQCTSDRRTGSGSISKTVSKPRACNLVTRCFACEAWDCAGLTSVHIVGKNPLVTYPRVPGHEIAATIEETQWRRSRRIAAGRECGRVALHQLRQVRFLPCAVAR